MKPTVSDNTTVPEPRKDPARSRVEGREELVRGIGPGLGQRIEQRRFPGVRIAPTSETVGTSRRSRARRRVLRCFSNCFEPLLEQLDAHPEHAAVGFELLFPRTAQADTALLAFEVGPTAHEAGREVFELSEFDLQLAFVAARALREDVENQAVAVDDPAVQRFFKIAVGWPADNSWLKRIRSALSRVAQRGDLFGFSAADEQRGIGSPPSGLHTGEHLSPRALRQKGDFGEPFGLLGFAEIDLDDDRPIAGFGSPQTWKPRPMRPLCEYPSILLFLPAPPEW